MIRVIRQSGLYTCPYPCKLQIMYVLWPPQHELTLALTILYNYKRLFFYLTLNFNSHTTSPPSSPSHTRLTLDHFIILASRSNLHCIFQLFSSVFSSVYKAVSKALYIWTPIQTHWILHLCIHSGKPCAETQGLQKPRIRFITLKLSVL